MRLLASNRDTARKTQVLIMREALLKWGGCFTKVGWKLWHPQTGCGQLSVFRCMKALKPTTAQIMNRLRLHFFHYHGARTLSSELPKVFPR